MYCLRLRRLILIFVNSLYRFCSLAGGRRRRTVEKQVFKCPVWRRAV
ncbi:hypothetical protein HMPREF0602_2063 [Neisseria meningitidis ATCC 13091]|uniref:Uncharacterized protein n=1 Tax=Neisseria meningitidis serogroup B (strain ATCC 13091 / M2091) TaxID=862513 RepID=E0NC31_NEIM3|nr:hypothetical protein HMPREF0602_2063 [Neisseria meningitidis ATCC 13091]